MGVEQGDGGGEDELCGEDEWEAGAAFVTSPLIMTYLLP